MSDRPDVLKDAERSSIQMKGVSLPAGHINDRGRKFIETTSNALDLFPVEFNDIAKGNDQPRHPERASQG